MTRTMSIVCALATLGCGSESGFKQDSNAAPPTETTDDTTGNGGSTEDGGAGDPQDDTAVVPGGDADADVDADSDADSDVDVDTDADPSEPPAQPDTGLTDDEICESADALAGYLDPWQTAGDGRVYYCHSSSGSNWVFIESDISSCLPHLNHGFDIFPTTGCDS